VRAFLRFSLDRRLVWRAVILAGLCLASLGVYLLASHEYYRLGFPLDDAWIHQTYARNLALGGEWAFWPGRPSAGSTSPLWSVLLAPGHLSALGLYVWTYGLGGLILWALAMLSEAAVETWVPTYRPRFPWVGAFMAFEWHLVWAAGSGMETLLAALLITFILIQGADGSRRHFGLGLLIGLSVWVRPDGATLLGPAALAALCGAPTWRRRLRALSGLGVGFGSVFVFYLLFNLALAGSPWPSTFYAKQAEYAVYQQIPLFRRFAAQVLQPLVGAGIALLPGAVMTVVRAVRKKRWGLLFAAVWCVGYLALYAWRLPVTYQHGRYVMPAMPIFFVLGLIGLAEYAGRRLRGYRWMVPAAWKLTLGLLTVVFWGRGAYAYAQDVAYIESEMVQTARWVAEHLPAEALVAAHDIGALGYFGNHELVDLAGLVSPEVIPFLRDEARLAAYLDERGADALVVFPGWYPSLTRGRAPVYATGAPFAPAMGEENMAVYLWPLP
jgi:hypothetical protein